MNNIHFIIVFQSTTQPDVLYEKLLVFTSYNIKII